MSPQDLQLNEALPTALAQLERLTQAQRFPDLQAPLEKLQQAIGLLHANPATPSLDAIRDADESVTRLYQTSMAQANAAPAKYQQPVFQCYSDYQKCTASAKTASGKAMCTTLFVLSLANKLLTISVSVKP